MKTKSIHNRKLILELRYDPVPAIIDKRGEFSDRLIEIPELNCKAWKISNDTIEAFDSENQNNITKRIFIGMNRLSFIDEYAIEHETFYETFLKIFEVFTSLLKEPAIRRIGCRIMGSYEPENGNINTPVPKFLEVFKDDALIKDFPVRDISLTITYSSGRYTIGPIRKDDNWILQNFRHDNKVQKGGFAIDTDNYAIDNNSKKGMKSDEIKNIYETSIQVEETLFTKLSSIYG
ncbi:MAG: hypothetical protein ACI8ZM_005678 [Crocinitomix sp.]|jgi:hypothetical protein